ncbi:MAG: hypothetical protein ACK417_02765 [Bacteroidia bacterium]
MCVTLENKNTGRIYEGNVNHAFDLRISHLAYGALTPALWLSSFVDTIRTHQRSIICSSSFSGTLAAANGDLISIEDGRFDFSSHEDLLLLHP